MANEKARARVKPCAAAAFGFAGTKKPHRGFFRRGPYAFFAVILGFVFEFLGGRGLDFAYPVDERLTDEAMAEQSLVDGEVERLRGQALDAFGENPGLFDSITTQGMAENYVEDWLDTVQAFARRMSQNGQTMVETLRKIDVRSELEAHKGVDYSKMTPEEYEARLLQEQSGKQPWLQQVYGRIDGASLQKDWPAAARKIAQAYGPGIFRKKAKGGLSLDELADELVRSGLLPEGSGADELVERLKTGEGKRLFQALVPEVDFDRELPVLSLAKEQMPAWQAIKSSNRKKIVSEILAVGEPWVNDFTGYEFSVSGNGLDHMLSSATNRGLGGEAHVAAVRNLHGLIKIAVPEEPYVKYEQPDVSHAQRFYAPMHYDGSIYTVSILSKVYNGKRTLSLEGVRRLYDAKLVKKQAPDGLRAAAGQRPGVSPPTGTLNITVRDMLSGVKGSDGKTLFQGFDFFNKAYPLDDGPEALGGGRTYHQTYEKGKTPPFNFRNIINIDSKAPAVNMSHRAHGSVTISPEKYHIRLFQNANLSTLLHETGHVFLEEMDSALKRGLADDALSADFAKLQDWLGAKPGETLNTSQREQFARGFESYLREGKAPTPNLQSAAPSGWVKETRSLYNDVCLRLVMGSVSSGGSAAFSSAMNGSVGTNSASTGGSVGDTTLSVSQMPVHQHAISGLASCRP